MIHIQRAKVLCPESRFHNKVCDFIVDHGKVVRISEKPIPTGKGTVIHSKDLHLSIGWFDLGTQIGDPGFEHKEDFESGLAAAAKGGFTGVAPMPNTFPFRYNKSAIKYAIDAGANHIVQVYPIGGLSKKGEGLELAELYDMTEAGASAFSDGLNDIHNPELQKLALLYSDNLRPPLLCHPIDHQLAAEGMMHEGPTSTSLGLRGIPAIAEELRVVRDLKLIEYTESGMHFFCISTKEALKRILEANSDELSSSVAISNLVWNDERLHDFDSSFKVEPPLRSESDRKFLLKALKNGNIQVLCSNHRPHEIEAKRCEFENAEFGMASIEVFLPLLMQAFKAEDLSEIISSFTSNPRKLLKLEIPLLEEDLEANLCLFDPSLPADLNFKSKAVNYPKLNEPKGKILGVIQGRKNNFA
jgi:dihydroorotase